VYSGIGAHQMGGNTDYLDEQITLSRDLHTSGVVIYKDDTLFPNNVPGAMAHYLKNHFFNESTPSPSYAWKTKTEFNAPSFDGLAVAEPRSGMAVLRWNPATDQSLPITYTIYQCTTPGGEEYTTPTYVTQETQYLVEGLTNGSQYYFVVRAEDDFANEDTNIEELGLTPDDEYTFLLEDFEAGTNAYWNGNHAAGIIFQDPGFSGYSIGLAAGSAIDVVTSPVQAGSFAGHVVLDWTDPPNGQCFLATDPDRPLCPDFTGWFSLWVYGWNDGTRLAAVFRDSAYERTPFVTINWDGWRKVEWFLPETAFMGWNGGNGSLLGGVFGGDFAGLLLLPGAGSSSVMFLDDVKNTIQPDTSPPEFDGVAAVGGSFHAATLSWNMAMDKSNPVVYNIYLSTSPGNFDFSTPFASTQKLQITLSLPLPGGEYYFVVRAQDSCGNEDDNTVVKGTMVMEEMLENFEAGTPAYWHGNHSSGIIFEDPNYSGSTTGLDSVSNWSIVTTPTVTGSYAGNLYLKWSDTVNGFCRITTHPTRPLLGDYRVTISAWIYGAGDDTRVALVLLDDVHTGAVAYEYEQSPYVTIDWTGWKKIEWVLPEIEWTGWANGTGTLEDLTAGGHLEALFFLPGDTTETRIYLDDIKSVPLPPPPITVGSFLVFY
jgi:hypothetical protein